MAQEDHGPGQELESNLLRTAGCVMGYESGWDSSHTRNYRGRVMDGLEQSEGVAMMVVAVAEVTSFLLSREVRTA